MLRDIPVGTCFPSECDWYIPAASALLPSVILRKKFLLLVDILLQFIIGGDRLFVFCFSDEFIQQMHLVSCPNKILIRIFGSVISVIK
jgi:hypothetical protein